MAGIQSESIVQFHSDGIIRFEIDHRLAGWVTVGSELDPRLGHWQQQAKTGTLSGFGDN